MRRPFLRTYSVLAAESGAFFPVLFIFLLVPHGCEEDDGNIAMVRAHTTMVECHVRMVHAHTSMDARDITMEDRTIFS